MVKEIYQKFSTTPWFDKAYCQDITTPCWIPHIGNIIQSISSGLPSCDTLEKYSCMLATVKKAKYAIKSHCPRSCISESYRVLTRTADIEPFIRVGR